MITGAIFDLDGTLLDSMGTWETVADDYLISIGYKPKSDLRERFRSMSQTQAAEHFISEYGVSLPLDDIVNGLNSFVEDFFKYKAELKPGVGEFLEKLAQKGVKMCVATATDKYMVEAALERCGVIKYFSKIFTCTEVGCAKNKPDIFRRATEYMGTDKAKTVVFEDTLYASKTAKGDGFTVIGVYDYYESHPEEIRSLVDLFITDFRKDEAFWAFASKL